MATPSHSGADRNLLFGILALQMDFIGKEDLIRAMHAWVLDKARSLGRILTDQGRLTPVLRQLLEALVDRHIQTHSGDAQQSLAAISPPPALQQELEEIADPDVQASLAHVPSEPRSRAEGTVSHITTSPSSQGLRYRILRPHARGGLGEVYVAEDVELRREVALKEIRKDHSQDDASCGRFVQEAEITGGLEHPGVVPVYGLGKYDDGRPFYAMRFIKGDNLKNAIRRFHQTEPAAQGPPGNRPETPTARNVAFRELLGRFVDVCNAVAYAHSRGVLHRDLKPGNIMLGKYGETLIVDWGLAKAVGRAEAPADLGETTLWPGSADSDRAATRMGTALGTPAFMSPEQAAGKLDQLGPASDIYSLGATFYMLLTGQAPFDGDAGEILRRVQQGEFPPPRQVKPGVPPALEGICLKAMAKRPQDRYRTPLELAEDIERWLADEPVSAHRDPLPARCGRWARRHRMLVAGLAAAALVAVVSLSVATVLLSAANQREVEAREQAQRNGEEAEREGARAQANFLLAKKRGEEAERESARARANFQLARDAVEEYCTKVSDDPRLKEKDLEGLRKDLLQSAVKFHQKFVKQHANDPALRADLGRAYLELSKLQLDTENVAEAITAARQAVATYERLARDHIGKSPYPEQLAMALAYLGMGLNRVTEHKEAQAVYYRALKTLDAERMQHGTSRPLRRAFLRNCRQLSFLLMYRAGAEAEAIAVYRKAAAFLEADQKPEASELEDVVDAAEIYAVLGEALVSAGQAKEGKVWCARALRTLEPLTAKGDPHSRVFGSLSSIYTNVGRAYMRMSELAKALQVFRQAVRLDRTLVAAHPAVTLYQQYLSTDLSDVSRALLRMGQGQEGFALLKESVAIKENLAARHPEVADFKSNLARGLYGLALITGDPGEARKLQARSESLLKELTTSYPKVATYQVTYASSIHVRAQLHQRAKESADAIAAQDQAIAIQEELLKITDTLENRSILRQWCLDQTEWCLKASRPQAAAAAFHKALALGPINPLQLYDYSTTLLNNGQPAVAELGFRRTLALKPDYAEAQCNLGHSLLRQGKFGEARAALQRGHELGLKKPGWKYPSDQWVRNADQMIQLDNRATAILARKAQPANSTEQVNLALFCQNAKYDYGAAARLYAGAFAATPELAEDQSKAFRYQAARTAALAASGMGMGADKLDDKQKTGLRRQALDWLGSDLKLFAAIVSRFQAVSDKDAKPASPSEKTSDQLKKPGVADLLRVCDRLQRWWHDPALARLREEKALARLPADQQKEWHNFWATAHAVDKQARGCFTERQFTDNLSGPKREQKHELLLQMGKTYAIDLESRAFDPVLRLQDIKGNLLAENDDIEPGVNLNSRIVFTPPEDGAYQLVASAFQGKGAGAYRVVIREFGGRK
jgi:serine/threonine-protein kinase